MKNTYTFRLLSTFFFQKRINYTRILVIVFLSLSTTAFADNDPTNNTQTGAESISLSTNISGDVDWYGGDPNDWYIINIPTDGSISISVNYTVGTGSLMGMGVSDLCEVTKMYDNFIPQSGNVYNIGKLAAGSYYVRMFAGISGAGGYFTYNFSVAFDPISVANDSAFNNSKLSAQSIQVNALNTGHISFINCWNTIDVDDWFTFTTTDIGNFKASVQLFTTTFDNPNGVGGVLELHGQFQLAISSSYAGPNNTVNLNLNYNSLSPGTYYLWLRQNGSGCGYTITDSLIPFYNTLNLKLLLQGYYIGSNEMTPALVNQGVNLTNTLTDSITVELRNTSIPYTVVRSGKLVLSTDGNASFTFPTISGSYYIAVKHRNGIQTWSAQPVLFGNNPVDYDFTTSASKAFGSNQVEVESGVFAFYSGDISQDENIDLLDLSEVETDINIFNFGYLPTDINGDGNVDLLDASFIETNINDFIFSNHP